MVAIYAAAREQRFLSAVRQRAGRLLGGAVLSVLATATIAAAPAAATQDPIGSVTINGAPARQCGTHPVRGGPFHRGQSQTTTAWGALR